MSATPATFGAPGVIAARLNKLGISTNTFIGLTGTSKSQMSRYLLGQTPMPADEVEHLYSALDVLEKLFEAFKPFRPDLKDGDVCGPLIRDFSKGLLVVKVTDDGELVRSRNNTQRGVMAALSGAQQEKPPA